MENTPYVSKVLFHGQRLDTKARDAISSVTLDTSTTQVTEIAITLEDPMFRMLKKGIFDKNSPVKYQGMSLIVAVIETTAGGGNGGVVIRCRPSAVNRLKALRGPRVMAGTSASEYVIAECKSAKVNYVVQPSTKKMRVVRDTVQKGQRYDEATYPSAWTTMQRLAGDIGYLMYEVNGIIYFGKPTWLVQHNGTVTVNWYPEDGTEPYSVPQFRDSIDNKDIELTVDVPLARAEEMIPGKGIRITGFPKYAGTYMITGVNYPLAGPGTVSVTAATVRDPEPQKGGDDDG